MTVYKKINSQEPKSIEGICIVGVQQIVDLLHDLGFKEASEGLGTSAKLTYQYMPEGRKKPPPQAYVTITCIGKEHTLKASVPPEIYEELSKYVEIQGE